MSLISAFGEGFHFSGLISIAVCGWVGGSVDSGGCTTGAVISAVEDPSIIGEAFPDKATHGTVNEPDRLLV